MNQELIFNRARPPVFCPGGLPPEDCETSSDLLLESRNFAAERGEFPAHWNRLTFLTRDCGNCALQCQIAVEIEGTIQTGRVKLTYCSAT